MGTLPEALAASLPAGSIRTNTPVRRVLRPEAKGPWRVELLDGPTLDASAVVVATEAHAAARLLDTLDPALASQLRSIPYASSAIANVAFRREDVAHPLDGFGAVVPIVEGRQILAVSFTSVKFPRRAPAGTVLMRVFVGGATQPQLYDLDDAETHGPRPPRAGRPAGRPRRADPDGDWPAIPAACRSTPSATSTASPRSVACRPSPRPRPGRQRLRRRRRPRLHPLRPRGRRRAPRPTGRGLEDRRRLTWNHAGPSRPPTGRHARHNLLFAPDFCQSALSISRPESGPNCRKGKGAETQTPFRIPGRHATLRTPGG